MNLFVDLSLLFNRYLIMKKFYNLFALTLLCMISIVSCVKEEIQHEIPRLSLSRDSLVVDAAEKSYSITYSIVHPVSDGIVQAESDAKWITVESVSDNVLRLHVDANEDDRRNAVVNLYYPDINTLASSLEVVQDSLVVPEVPDDNLLFDIVVEDKGYEGGLISFTPQDELIEFFIANISVEEYQALGGTDEALFDKLSSDCWSNALKSGRPIDEYMNEFALRKGYQCEPFGGLYPGKNYYAVAVGMDCEAKQTTELVKQEWSTTPVEMNGATFDCGFVFKQRDVQITVTPSSDELYYFFDCIRKVDAENLGMTIEESIKSLIDEKIAYLQEFGISREEILTNMLNKGKKEFTYSNLNASTTYLAVAVSVNMYGYLDSETDIEEFNTEYSVDMSDNKLQLNVPYVGVDCISVNVKTSNADPYCLVCVSTSTYPGLSPEECVEKLEGSSVLNACIHNGDISGTITKLNKNTEYYLLLFGYENGCVTTDLIAETVVTKNEGDPSSLAFNFSFTDVTENSLVAKVNPTPDNAKYVTTIVDAYFTEDDVYDYIEESASLNGVSPVVFLKQISVRGPQETKFEILYPDTQYKVFAIGVNGDTGQYATEVFFSEIIKTSQRTVSDTRITFEDNKYFNGAEVAELYPYHATASDRAIFPIKAIVTGDVEKYSYMLYVGDMSDEEIYPDYGFINDFAAYGSINNIERYIFYCNYDQAYTLIGVTKDSKGYYSEVYRKVIVCEEDGCSPVEEFVPIPGQERMIARSFQKQRSLKFYVEPEKQCGMFEEISVDISDIDVSRHEKISDYGWIIMGK